MGTYKNFKTFYKKIWKYLDKTKKKFKSLMFSKFQKYFQKILKNMFDDFVEMYQKICKIISENYEGIEKNVRYFRKFRESFQKI